MIRRQALQCRVVWLALGRRKVLRLYIFVVGEDDGAFQQQGRQVVEYLSDLAA